VPAKLALDINTCRVLGKRGRWGPLWGKGEGERGKKKPLTFTLYPLTFSPNPIPS